MLVVNISVTIPSVAHPVCLNGIAKVYDTRTSSMLTILKMINYLVYITSTGKYTVHCDYFYFGIYTLASEIDIVLHTS